MHNINAFRRNIFWNYSNECGKYEDPKLRDEDADFGDGYANFGDVPSGHEKKTGYENQAIAVQHVDETRSKPAESATKCNKVLFLC